MQGDDPDHLKSAACAKHFAVHSGPEAIRHEFDAKASKHDMYDTYLYAFKRCVKDAKVEAVMGAYNRVNGEPACGSRDTVRIYCVTSLDLKVMWCQTAGQYLISTNTIM